MNSSSNRSSNRSNRSNSSNSGNRNIANNENVEWKFEFYKKGKKWQFGLNNFDTVESCSFDEILDTNNNFKHNTIVVYMKNKIENKEKEFIHGYTISNGGCINWYMDEGGKKEIWTDIKRSGVKFSENDKNILKTLIASHFNIYLAIEQNDIDTINELLEIPMFTNLAIPYPEDNLRYTPLLYAIRGHSYEYKDEKDKKDKLNNVKEILKNKNVDVNKILNGDTTLTYAIDNEDREVVKELLKHPKIDVNLKNVDGLTPLTLAINYDDFEIIKLLLKHSKIDKELVLNINTEDITDNEIKKLIISKQKQIRKQQRSSNR